MTRKIQLNGKEWFVSNKINIMKWMAQFLDLNPLENLWIKIHWILSNITQYLQKNGRTFPTGRNHTERHI